MRQYDAPAVLKDPDGEGVYVRSGLPLTLARASYLLGVPWREIETTSVSMIPSDDEDESWRPVSFRNWRWWLWPITREPAVFLYCVPAGASRGGEG